LPGVVFEKKHIYNWQPVISEKQLIDTSRFLVNGRSYQYLTFSCIVTPQLLEKNYTRIMLANIVSPEKKTYMKVNYYIYCSKMLKIK